MGSRVGPQVEEENALRDLWINFNWIRHKEVEIGVQQEDPAANRDELLNELEELWMLLGIQLRLFLQVYPERDSNPRVFNIISQLIRDSRLVPSQ
jgi:hypothetical protein